MTGIPLFIAVPTGTCKLVLRRFRLGRTDGHLHDASIMIDDIAPVTPDRPDGTKPITDHRVPHDDPRWPAACECGEQFTDADYWQVNELDWYQGGDTRFAFGVGSWDGPPGAMMRTPWRDVEDRPPAYQVFLPNGTGWNTNDRSSVPGSNQVGPFWEVTGTAPAITVVPSIDDQGSRPWHGWIRNGELVRA